MRMFLTIVESDRPIKSLVLDEHYASVPHFGVEIDVTREEVVGLDENSFCDRYLAAAVCQVRNKLVEG